MIIRTTKQIKEDIQYNEEWVCLSSLQKEITALAKRENYKNNEIKQLVLDDIYDLCKSPEQNDIIGGEPSKSRDNCVGREVQDHSPLVSSPVQNPQKKCTCPEPIVGISDAPDRHTLPYCGRCGGAL